jgi:hypothetical protein
LKSSIKIYVPNDWPEQFIPRFGEVERRLDFGEQTREQLEKGQEIDREMISHVGTRFGRKDETGSTV